MGSELGMGRSWAEAERRAARYLLGEEFTAGWDPCGWKPHRAQLRAVVLAASKTSHACQIHLLVEPKSVKGKKKDESVKWNFLM